MPRPSEEIHVLFKPKKHWERFVTNGFLCGALPFFLLFTPLHASAARLARTPAHPPARAPVNPNTNQSLSPAINPAINRPTLLSKRVPVAVMNMVSDMNGFCITAPVKTAKNPKLTVSPCNYGTEQEWLGNGETIKFKANSLCLATVDKNAKEGARPTLSRCDAKPDQKWTRTNKLLKNRSNSKLCFGIESSSRTEGAGVIMMNCSGDKSQSWHFVSVN